MTRVLEAGVLDLATGTATSSAPISAAGAEVVACDFPFGMLAEGRRRWPSIACG
ncbi:MAG: hypothetical protein U0990_11045 [Candidatus Nanopelagicales bacterium]|nr:hypothetical protein [Candidatus Nanopelagicales bacterium]MDZ4250603.1 hypothetical protein [Candidatus Nanopelagicales bacterium]